MTFWVLFPTLPSFIFAGDGRPIFVYLLFYLSFSTLVDLMESFYQSQKSESNPSISMYVTIVLLGVAASQIYLIILFKYQG